MFRFRPQAAWTKGIGALYVRKGIKFKPLIVGGPQERRRGRGPRTCPASSDSARRRSLQRRNSSQSGRRSPRRDRLEQGVLRLGIAWRSAMSAAACRTPPISPFERLEGEAIIHHLNRAGIAASLGSACASGSMEPSHVLRAMNVPPTALRGAIRFSLSRETPPTRSTASSRRCLTS